MHRNLRRTTLLPALTAGLLGIALAAPPPAQAAGEASCTQAGGGLLLMYVNHPAVVPFLELSTSSGSAVVSIGGSPVGSCALSGSTEVRPSSASGFGAWMVSDADAFVNDVAQPTRFAFGENDPVLVVHGNPMTSASWHSTGGQGIDLNGNGVADVTAVDTYSQLVLLGSDNPDTIDLAGGGIGTFQGSNTTIKGQGGNDTLVGGAQSDVVEGGDGDDQLSGWTGSDSLVPGNGADQGYGNTASGSADVDDGYVDTFVLDYDAAEDVMRGDGSEVFDSQSVVGFQFSNGGSQDDGAPFEGDTYSGFATVTTANGPDWVETTGVGHVATGQGNDTVIVGASPNGLMADAGDGVDTLDLSEQTGPTSGTLAATNGSFVVPSFPQNSAEGFEALVGGSGADTWTIDCACRVEPRGGADDLHFTDGGGTFVAGPSADGADTVLAEDDLTATADYSQRAAAVSLTLDAEANDGAAGEGDALDGLTTLLSGSGADTIVGDSAANVIDGGAGNDVLNGRGGPDVVRGDLGTDRVSGGSGDDRLLGGTGGDTLLGGDGDDRLLGDAPTDPTGGKDTLDGGPGDDDELGYGGNDTFTQGAVANGQDLLVGGTGTDLASYALRTGAVRLSLNGAYDDGGAGEGDRLGGSIENLAGGKGADAITGNSLANLITGGAGKDTLSGLAGNDTFQSLDGVVDALLGGTGTDRAHRDTSDTVTSVEQRF